MEKLQLTCNCFRSSFDLSTGEMGCEGSRERADCCLKQSSQSWISVSLTGELFEIDRITTVCLLCRRHPALFTWRPAVKAGDSEVYSFLELNLWLGSLSGSFSL